MSQTFGSGLFAFYRYVLSGMSLILSSNVRSALIRGGFRHVDVSRLVSGCKLYSTNLQCDRCHTLAVAALAGRIYMFALVIWLIVAALVVVIAVDAFEDKDKWKQ